MRPTLPATFARLALALAPFLAGCASVEKIRQDGNLRAASRQPVIDGNYKEIVHRDEIPEPYAHEHDYIRARRKAALPTPVSSLATNAPPPDMLGVCFSGGGIRSATFNLGALQALHDGKVLPHVDYLSTVSGGAYIGSWFVSHLSAPGTLTTPDEIRSGNGVIVQADKAATLLESQPADALEPSPTNQLLGNAAFLLNGANGFAGVKLAWSYLWRLPVHLVFDVALHVKLTRGKFNWHHPVHIYKDRIAKTYLAPPIDTKGQILLKDINPPGCEAPYLIINAAWALGPSPETNRPFEFTRDYCGAPGLGYLPTPLFNYPVKDVLWGKQGVRGKDALPGNTVLRERSRPRYVKVGKSPLPLMPASYPFAVSHAVAASGAALDGATVDSQFLRTVLLLFNANLRYQARNFGMSMAVFWKRPFDLLREITVDRFSHSPTQNTLHLTDGAHYENFGLVALLKRKVSTILIFDVGSDSNYLYSSLAEAESRVNATTCSCGHPFNPWNFHRTIPKGVAPTPEGLRSSVSCSNPRCGYEASVILVENSLAALDPKGLPTSLATFAKHDSRDFPHTSTLIQSYDHARFEAYRMNGYRLTTEFLRNWRESPAKK